MLFHSSQYFDWLNRQLPLLADIINDCLKWSMFLDELKLAKVLPLFKKTNPLTKTTDQLVYLLKF